MADIDYRQIASHIVKDSKKLKAATRNTLNDVAFIAQRDMTKQAESDLNFRKSAKRALGFRVNKASYGKMEASIETKRGWLYYHLESGTRHATSGVHYQGTSYLVVPVPSATFAFTKTGKLKKSVRNGVFIIKSRGNVYMFHRKKARGKRRAQAGRGHPMRLIANLERSVKHNEDTDPAESVIKALERDGLRILQKELNYKR